MFLPSPSHRRPPPRRTWDYPWPNGARAARWHRCRCRCCCCRWRSSRRPRGQTRPKRPFPWLKINSETRVPILSILYASRCQCTKIKMRAHFLFLNCLDSFTFCKISWVQMEDECALHVECVSVNVRTFVFTLTVIIVGVTAFAHTRERSTFLGWVGISTLLRICGISRAVLICGIYVFPNTSPCAIYEVS